MTNYINFGAMSPQQRQVFNASGYADKEYVMSKNEWEDILETLVGGQQVGKESLGNVEEMV